MKYKDLIEMLKPFADEEINIAVSSAKEPANPYDLKNWDKVTTDRVGFFRNCEDGNDLIVRIEQKYDSKSFDNIGETKLFKI